MEHTNFSYAKRTKIFGMMIFIIVSIIYSISFISLVNATFVWGTNYTYDNYLTGNVNWTKWSNTSVDIHAPAIVTENINSDINLYCISTIFNLAQHMCVGTLFNNATTFPNINALDKITFKSRLDEYHGRCYIIVFGTSLLYSELTNGYSKTSNFTLIRNYTYNNDNVFDYYDDSGYLGQLTATNNLIMADFSTFYQNQYPGQCQGWIYPVNYSYGNSSLNITLLSPSNNFNHYNVINVSFNVSSIAYTNNLFNITLYIDGNANETQSITGTSNISTFTKGLSVGAHNWYVKVCDDGNNCKNSETRIIQTYPFNITQTYNATTWETSHEYFISNISLGETFVSEYLNYNGTIYTGTVNSSTGDNIVSTSFDIPLTLTSDNVPVNRTFYWIINTLSGTYNTPPQTQTIYPINLSVCGYSPQPNNITFMNFTYKDEMQYFNINASVPQATFNYWLGQGNVQKNYFYSSYVYWWFILINASEAPSTAFCFSPANKTLNTNYVYQASSTGTPGVSGSNYLTRTFNSIFNLSIPNSNPLNQIFYLIQAGQSGSVTIQVVDLTSGNVIPNARVTVTRPIQGQTVAILDGYTDSAGTINTYLSSTVSYTITAQKPGCGSNTQAVTPVGSYNMQLNCAGNLTPYQSDVNGVMYQHTPTVGVSQPGNTNFSYYVYSAFSPIVAAKFELWDELGNMVDYNESFVVDNHTWCTTKSCLLTLQYYTACADNIKGRYYVNLGNVSNYTYILLEKDAFWKYICINQNNSQQAWTKTINSFNTFMAAWTGSGTNNNCIIYNTHDTCSNVSVCKWVTSTEFSTVKQQYVTIGACVLKDNANKAEFNRMLIIFFGMVVVLFIIGKGTSFELTNPGSFVMFMAIIIFILSVGGMFTFQGLTPWDWFNQYIYAYICIVISAGYNVSIIRRYSA